MMGDGVASKHFDIQSPVAVAEVDDVLVSEFTGCPVCLPHRKSSP